MSGESSQTRMAGFQSASVRRGHRGHVAAPALRRPRRLGPARPAPDARRAGARRGDRRDRLDDGAGAGRHRQEEARAGPQRGRRRARGRRPSGRARRRDTLRPSPEPPARAAAALPNSNSSNTRSHASGSMPGPVSSTRILEDVGAPADVDPDVPLLGELGGVGDQVEDDLAHAQLVDRQPLRDGGVDLGQHRDAGSARQPFDCRDDVADDVPDRGRLRVGGGVSGGEPRIVQQVVDQAQQVRAVADDDLSIRLPVVRDRACPGRSAGRSRGWRRAACAARGRRG